LKLIEPLIINEKHWVVKPDIYVKKNRLASPAPKRVGLFNSKTRSRVRRSIQSRTPSSERDGYAPATQKKPLNSRLSNSMKVDKRVQNYRKTDTKPDRYASKQNILSGNDSNYSYQANAPKASILKQDQSRPMFDSES